MILEMLYIICAVIFVAVLGIPYLIERDKYKKMLREIEKEKDGQD